MRCIIQSLLIVLLVGCGGSDRAEEVNFGYIPNNTETVDQVLYNQTWKAFHNRGVLNSRFVSLENEYTFPVWDVSEVFNTSVRLEDTRTHANTAWDTGPYPPNTFWVTGNQYGVHLNTATFPRQTIVGGGYHAIYSRAWKHEDAKYPWRHGKGLWFELELAIPTLHVHSEGELAVPQVSIVFYGNDYTDPAQPRGWCILINILETGGEYAPFVAHDTFTFFYSTPFANTNGFTARNGKHVTGVIPKRDYYLGGITKDNILAIIEQTNKKIAAAGGDAKPLSTNLDKLGVTSAHVLIEIAAGDTSDVVITTHWRNFQFFSW